MLSTISLKAFFIYAIVTFPNGEDNLRWHQNYSFKDYATCMTFVSQNVEELAGGLKQLIIMEIGPDKVHLTSLKEIGCSMAPPEEENKAQEIKV